MNEVESLKKAMTTSSAEVSELRGRNYMAAVTITELRKGADEAALENEALQLQIESSTSAVTELAAIIDQLEATGATMSGENRRLQQRVGRMVEDQATVRKQVGELKSQIRDLEQEKSTSMVIQRKLAKFEDLSKQLQARVTALDEERTASVASREDLVAKSSGFEALAKEFEKEKEIREQKAVEIARLKADAAASTKTRDVIKGLTDAMDLVNSDYVQGIERSNTSLQANVTAMTTRAQTAKAKQAAYATRVDELKGDATERMANLQKTVDAAVTKLVIIDDATTLTADTTMSLLQRGSAFEDFTLAKMAAVEDRLVHLQKTADTAVTKLLIIDDATTLTADTTMSLLQRGSIFEDATSAKMAAVEDKLVRLQKTADTAETTLATIDNATAFVADTTISLLQRKSAFEDATSVKLAAVEDKLVRL